MAQAASSRSFTSDNSQRFGGKLLWALLLVLVCAHFSLSYVGENHSFLNLQLYSSGGERLPFQYRTLVAFLFRHTAATPFFGGLARRAPSNFRDPFRLAYLLITFVSLLGSVLATRASLSRLTRDPAFSGWACFLVVYMAYFNLMLAYGLNYTLPYDVPSLFFFSLCVLLIIDGRKWLYYPCFALAVFNRETICFAAVFFAIWEWFERNETRPSERLARIAPHILLQAAIWVAIKLYLARLYGHNPAASMSNPFVEGHFVYNLKEVAKPWQWPLLLSNFGFTLPVLLAGRRWIDNRAIAWACAILLPLWFGSMMVVGVIVEIRIFTELIAVLSLAVGLILHSRFRPRYDS
jgi:hypothetical protein